jgi:xanthine dehydrogenase accessory factor
MSSEGLGRQSGFRYSEFLRSCLKKETSELFTDQAPWSEVFVEPILPRPRLIIAGGGHVGRALAQQAALVGFDVTVLDDRREFVCPDLFPPGVTTQYCDMVSAVTDLDLKRDTFIVIVTRGHQSDAHVLEACINRPAGYIGMIGSQRKIGVIRSHMIESGITDEATFDRIYAPIGLDIGSITASEIAASIVAQLIDVRRKGRVS